MTAVEANPRANLSGMTFTQLRDWIDDNTDLKPYRTGQIFSWIHQKRARAFSEMTSISKSKFSSYVSGTADWTKIVLRPGSIPAAR